MTVFALYPNRKSVLEVGSFGDVELDNQLARDLINTNTELSATLIVSKLLSNVVFGLTAGSGFLKPNVKRIYQKVNAYSLYQSGLVELSRRPQLRV